MTMDYKKAIETALNWRSDYEEISSPEIHAFLKGVIADDPDTWKFADLAKQGASHEHKDKAIYEFMTDFQSRYSS